MTISNGSVVLAADVNGMLAVSLNDVRDDDAQLPIGAEFNILFPNLVAGTIALSRRFEFVAPCDLLVESMAVQAADMTPASTLTVRLTGNGPITNWPITVTGTVGAGVVALPRLLFDNSKTNVSKDFATTAQAFRVFPKGSTIVVFAETTSIATPSTVQVCLVFREFFGRE